MKIIYALFFLLPFIMNGQNFTFGLQAGTTISQVRGFDSSYDYPSAIDIVAGVHIEYHITYNLSIVTSINYERKAVFREFSFFDLEGELTPTKERTNYNFLTVPLLLRYSFGKEKLKFFVNTGGYIAFLQKVKIEEFDLGTDGYEDNEYGISFGLGSIYKLNDKFNISLEIRDNLGLSNIKSGPVNIFGGDLNTNSINILIGGSISMY